MSYDVIRLKPSDLDEIYRQLSANGREFFNADMLEHIPLPSVAIEYEVDELPHDKKFRETYDLEWLEDEPRRGVLTITMDPDDGGPPAEFAVCIDREGNEVKFSTPIYLNGCTPTVKAVLQRPYSDDLVKDVPVWCSFPSRFFNVNRFIAMMTPELILNVRTEARKNGGKSPHRQKKSKKPNKVSIYKVYSLKNDWKDIAREHRHNLRHCPAWGVRGHYRHYKSGKVVWINAQVRGKDREKYQGKEYKLFKDMV